MREGEGGYCHVATVCTMVPSGGDCHGQQHTISYDSIILTTLLIVQNGNVLVVQ
jgi:hypothetical protein